MLSHLCTPRETLGPLHGHLRTFSLQASLSRGGGFLMASQGDVHCIRVENGCLGTVL